LFDPDARLVDASGKVWSAADLRETTVIVMLFTMLPTSMLALLKIVQFRRVEDTDRVGPRRRAQAGRCDASRPDRAPDLATLAGDDRDLPR
jgi:hypothetical protein